MTNRITGFLIFASMTVFFSSCLGTKTDLIFEPVAQPESEALVPEQVSYDYLKKEVLTPHCIKCHDRMGDQKLLEWWLVPGVPEESELLLAMEDGSMPPARAATTRELEIVRRYIEQLKPQ